MSEQKDQKSNVNDTIKAVTGLVEKIPIYQDAVQPLAIQTGKALETLGQVVNAALVPVKGLVWGVDKIQEFVQEKVAKNLEDVPVENIQSPDPAVAGPALESLKYAGHKEELADLYAKLIASAMDKSSSGGAHPGFVEIIRNLSVDEAKVFTYLAKVNVAPIINIVSAGSKGAGSTVISEYFSHIGIEAKVDFNDLMPSYLTNLKRLGLIDIPNGSYMTREDAYTKLEEDMTVKATLAAVNAAGKASNQEGRVDKAVVKTTPLGLQFSKICIGK